MSVHVPVGLKGTTKDTGRSRGPRRRPLTVVEDHPRQTGTPQDSEDPFTHGRGLRDRDRGRGTTRTDVPVPSVWSSYCPFLWTVPLSSDLGLTSSRSGSIDVRHPL